MLRRLALLILIAGLPIGLPACTEFPELDAAVDASAVPGAYPVILPLDSLLAQASVTTPGPVPQAELEARAEALRRKAADLRATP